MDGSQARAKTPSEEMRAVRDLYLTPTPDKTDTAWAKMTGAIEVLQHMEQAAALLADASHHDTDDAFFVRVAREFYVETNGISVWSALTEAEKRYYGRRAKSALTAAGFRFATEALTLDNYQTSAHGTAVYPGIGTPIGLLYASLKLAGEAGEVSEKVGKAIRDDGMIQHTGGLLADSGGQVGWDFMAVRVTPERREALKKELGDVLWYVTAAASELGYTLSEVAQGNLDKLADRAARGTLQGSGDDR